MKMHLRLLAVVCLAAFLCALWSGCASAPDQCFSKNIGKLTYDQAVTMLGKPWQTNRLADGTVSADWLLRNKPDHTTISSTDPSLKPHAHDQYLRLIFNKEGLLSACQTVTQ